MFQNPRVYFLKNLKRLERRINLFKLLLGAQVVGVSTLGLAAVASPGMQAGIAFAADHLVTVVLLC